MPPTKISLNALSGVFCDSTKAIANGPTTQSSSFPHYPVVRRHVLGRRRSQSTTGALLLAVSPHARPPPTSTTLSFHPPRHHSPSDCISARPPPQDPPVNILFSFMWRQIGPCQFCALFFPYILYVIFANSSGSDSGNR